MISRFPPFCLPAQISNALVDGMITVKTDEICAAIKMCFNDTRSVLEPAGALGIAGTHYFFSSTLCCDLLDHITSRIPRCKLYCLVH